MLWTKDVQGRARQTDRRLEITGLETSENVHSEGRSEPMLYSTLRIVRAAECTSDGETTMFTLSSATAGLNCEHVASMNRCEVCLQDDSVQSTIDVRDPGTVAGQEVDLMMIQIVGERSKQDGPEHASHAEVHKQSIPEAHATTKILSSSHRAASRWYCSMRCGTNATPTNLAGSASVPFARRMYNGSPP